MSRPHRDAAKGWIVVGDWVCYAAMSGQSTRLKFGIVTGLAERETGWGDHKAIAPTLRVITVNRRGDRWELQNGGKPVTIDRLENVLVTPMSHVPIEAESLLTEAFAKRKK